jgi:hypothetical protein
MTGPEVEKKISKWHYRLELVRTLVPLIILALQVAIFVKMFFR